MHYAEYFTDVQNETDISEITKIFEENKKELFIYILEKIWNLNISNKVNGFTLIPLDINTTRKINISDITMKDYSLLKINIESVDKNGQPVTYNYPFGPITMIGPINIFYLNSKLNNNTIFNLEFKTNNTNLTPQLDYILETLKKSKGIIYLENIKQPTLKIEYLDYKTEILILNNIISTKVFIKHNYPLTLIILNSNIKVEFIYENPSSLLKNIECPKTECPKTECPKTECPKTECPKTECPKTECPKTECPKTECPKTECPKTECPKTECPKTECPKTECPKTECPKTECPKTECPKTECPKTECPKTECPPEKDYTIWFVLLFLIILILSSYSIYSILFSKEESKTIE